MLNFSHFSKTYKNGKRAVSDLNLVIEAGDIYGFIGHNGAGKTTTIKAATGVLDFEEGDITIDGISIKDNPAACKARLAYIPDNPDLYEYLTGIQYLSFISDVFRIPDKLRTKRIGRYADMLELTSSLGDLISSYSHGMKQKLVLISALIHEPKLMILDEPFVGLDPKATATLKSVMRDMCAAGSAIFFSTHVLEVAEKLCTKIAIIKNGQLMVAGPTKDVVQDETLEARFLQIDQ